MSESSLDDIIAALSSKLRIPPGLDLVTAIEKMEQCWVLPHGFPRAPIDWV